MQMHIFAFFCSLGHFAFYNGSFNHLTYLSNVYLNESAISANKCVFMHSIERLIQRQIMNKFVFYKSLNLLTVEQKVSINCELTFELLQFKIHFNLRTDEDYKSFFDKCQHSLILRENNYNHILKKCFSNLMLDVNVGFEIRSDNLGMNRLLIILNDHYYLATIMFLLMILVPYWVLIVIFKLTK